MPIYATLYPCQLPFFAAGLLVALAGVGALVPGPHPSIWGDFAVLLIKLGWSLDHFIGFSFDCRTSQGSEENQQKTLTTRKPKAELAKEPREANSRESPMLDFLVYQPRTILYSLDELLANLATRQHTSFKLKHPEDGHHLLISFETGISYLYLCTDLHRVKDHVTFIISFHHLL